ncbi:MAG: murG, partial [Gammaproteobacteria bacterium]|nr:murG [Gammaproteobacteria bacterium]
VSELAVAGKPAILVPLPYAVDDHQRYNAKYLADQGAAVLKLQSDCNAAALAELLHYYSNNRQEVYQMAQTAKKLARPDATDAVMKACIDLMEKHK